MIQGAWPREGTASSIRGCVLTKLRISSGKALEALYCMPGAAQHPGLGRGEGWSGKTWRPPLRGSDSLGCPYSKGLGSPPPPHCTMAIADLCAVQCLVAQSCPTLCDPIDFSLPGSSAHGDSPRRNTGVGCHALFQGIFPTGDQTQVSCIAGGFFTV